MVKVNIHGYSDLQLKHAVFDYNGTLACGGIPLDGVLEELKRLNKIIEVHILTADTFNRVREAIAGYTFKLHILESGKEDIQKRYYIKK